ncbi:BolA protein [Blastomyces dermatitidis ER-3]|uniref:BolA protein n=2 Tax=Ajellomyces dermatitidis TaxID=5039 RepID=F2TTD5_AJEDA|nr:BolA protein [Blastomyces dermatitidis ER-3]EEQ92310.2 BolA protein [Blastomyces dermatitidis ER-3]EGE86498.2 BolA protein [Blastomyces dermatitidis ATCC 18188]EQL29144.1 BolA protein [Blastomyces dermatitidis ATCC 26199]
MLRSILPRQNHLLLLTGQLRSISSATTMSSTPMEDAIREKLQQTLQPSTLIIRNDSKLHAHHAPMRGNTSTETHFHITVTSPSFVAKTQAARHRMVYAALKEELAREGGIHALQLKTRTVEEEARDQELGTKEKEVEAGE